MTEFIDDQKSRRKKEKQKRIEAATKVELPDKNPCISESQLVLKCLDDNDYHREQCTLHFQNYKNCKKFWSAVQRERWWHGITPHLPPPEEREQVKREFSERKGYGYR